MLKRSLDGLLIFCALVMTASAMRRVWWSAPADTDGAIRFPGWREDLAFNRRIGLADASYRLIVSTDYQCPACRQFEKEIASARAQLGGGPVRTAADSAPALARVGRTLL